MIADYFKNYKSLRICWNLSDSYKHYGSEYTVAKKILFARKPDFEMIRSSPGEF